MSITPAQILWQTDEHSNSVPTSAVFDDVYFSKTGGLAETQYVFLDSNELPHRFANLDKNQSFIIAETGFGTGLNFLATCLLWKQLTPPSARLYFVSTEKYPLGKDDLARALSVWQNDKISIFINELIDKYPLALAGCHRLHFGNIVLDLWLGDANESFSCMNMAVDAWFLDGFAPAKNDELWSDEIFKQIKRLSKPNATLATFTSSGAVRRALQGIGMTVQKIKGFGRKREMITAHFTGDFAPTPTPKTATVIGVGVSGLFTAHALASRGIAVTLMDKTAPLAGASGNPKALFAPKLTQISEVAHHLSTISFLYSERIYRTLNALTDDEIFTQTGVVDFMLPTQKSHEKLANLVKDYPNEFIRLFNDEFNSENSDFNTQIINTFIAKAGLIDTHKLANTILKNPLINFKKFNVKSIYQNNNQVIIQNDSEQHSSDIVVICAGFESYLLNDTLFNPRKIRGQVSWININNKSDELKHTLTTPIKYDGYCATFAQDDDTVFLMGASFVRNDTDTSIRDDEHRFNLDKLNQSLPNIATQLNISIDDLQGRASIRAQTPDYHPLIGKVVGQIDNQIYTLYGMGSKGFCFAPLCADILASQICDEPLPISTTLLDKLQPHRPRLQNPIDQNR